MPNWPFSKCSGSRERLAAVSSRTGSIPNGGPSYYTTVQKLLERLEAKGYVAQEQGPGVLTFKATISRDDLISRRLLDMAEKLCEGSVTPLLINLVRSNRLGAEDLRSSALSSIS